MIGKRSYLGDATVHWAPFQAMQFLDKAENPCTVATVATTLQEVRLPVIGRANVHVFRGLRTAIAVRFVVRVSVYNTISSITRERTFRKPKCHTSVMFVGKGSCILRTVNAMRRLIVCRTGWLIRPGNSRLFRIQISAMLLSIATSSSKLVGTSLSSHKRQAL